MFLRKWKGLYRKLEASLKNQSLAELPVSGRYYAMDRDKRWDRTKLARCPSRRCWGRGR